MSPDPWHMSAILATQEAGIWRIAAQGQARQKSSQHPTSTEELGVVHVPVIPAMAGNIK
jgi:hypothetical protein